MQSMSGGQNFHGKISLSESTEREISRSKFANVKGSKAKQFFGETQFPAAVVGAEKCQKEEGDTVKGISFLENS